MGPPPTFPLLLLLLLLLLKLLLLLPLLAPISPIPGFRPLSGSNSFTQSSVSG